jgi:hypothetical protein
MAIHLCGVLAGISCGYLVLSTTMSPRSLLRECSVWIWGFRGPLGAFIVAWGGIAMLTSAPFDDWWHNAYGLDVKILSPPHMVLALGIFAVHVGALVLILGQMNRADEPLKSRFRVLFLYVGGLILVNLTIVIMEFTSRVFMHQAHFYRIVAMVTPAILAGVARASRFRWAATAVAAVYSLFLLGMIWILPLFAAEPKLGPVYHQVTQFIPPEFPLLFIVPALVLDWLWARTATWGTFRQAIISGIVFVAVFAAVQWPFANFLMSPAARNAVFGTKYFGYMASPNSLGMRYLFVKTEPFATFWREGVAAVVIAILASWLGLAWGNRMLRIRR